MTRNPPVSLTKATRPTDYPTGDGLSFICNRWTYTGPQGYRVVPYHESGDTARYGWTVVRYNATGSRPASYGSEPLTEDEAHMSAASLSGRSVNERF